MEKTDRQLMEEILADCKEIEKMLFAVRTSLNVLARNTTKTPARITMVKGSHPSENVHYKDDDVG